MVKDKKAKKDPFFKQQKKESKKLIKDNKKMLKDLYKDVLK